MSETQVCSIFILRICCAALDFLQSIGVQFFKDFFVPIYNPNFLPRYHKSSLVGASNKFTSSDYTALRTVLIYSEIISLQGDRFSYVSANFRIYILCLVLLNILGLKTLEVLEDA
jgi:hypothetical protein